MTLNFWDRSRVSISANCLEILLKSEDSLERGPSGPLGPGAQKVRKQSETDCLSRLFRSLTLFSIAFCLFGPWGREALRTLFDAFSGLQAERLRGAQIHLDEK